MNSLRLVRSLAAEDDLITIWLYVSGRNPHAADELLDALDRRPQMLVDHPYAGIARDDLRPGVRQLVEGHYLIFYRVNEFEVNSQRITSDSF